MLRILLFKNGGVMRYDEKITSGEQECRAGRFASKCKCHKQHKSTFLQRHLCSLCAFVARRTSPLWATPGARALSNDIQRNNSENCRMCVNTHIKKWFIRDISKFGENSIQVSIRFGFNDRVTAARFCFQARAIKNCNHSSTVTNQFADL